jgi:hypothetical protein
MKLLLYLVIGIAALLALGYVVSAVVGLLFWAAVAVVVGAVIAAVLRGSSGGLPLLKSPNKRTMRKIEKGADRALKELETKLPRE